MKPARTLCVILFFILHPSSFILSQETEPPKKPGVKLMFVPPPMDGTISLGIYDAKGKLARTLHREAEVDSDEFGKALNGLITYWDGKNDAGVQMPAGKYFARGYMVGEIKCEGEAFLCNDWIVNEQSPRIRRIVSGDSMPDPLSWNQWNQQPLPWLFILVETPSGLFSEVGFDEKGDFAWQKDFPKGTEVKEYDGNAGLFSISDGKIVTSYGAERKPLDLPDIKYAVAISKGRENTVWVIDKTQDQDQLKQYSMNGELLRRLVIQKEEPRLKQISASAVKDQVFLLETDGRVQRARVLALDLVSESTTGIEPRTSSWKVLLSKNITISDTLDAVRDKLNFPNGQPFVPQEKIKVDLQTNLLTPDQPASAGIAIGIDAKGSFLKTADGLELERVSETPNLRWAALGRPKDSRVVTIFQSDGAVVEEFKVRGLASMMAFDCGDFDYDPAKDK